MTGQMGKMRTGNQNILKVDQRQLPHRFGHADRGGDHRKIHRTFFDRFHRLRGGMVENLDMDAGIIQMKIPKHRKQQPVQRNLTDTDGEMTAVQPPHSGDSRFPGLQLFHGNLDVGKQLFSLRRQGYPPVGAQKQPASQLLFQIVHGAGDVGLAVDENLCSSGKAVVFGHIIEDPVVIVGDGHGAPSPKGGPKM